MADLAGFNKLVTELQDDVARLDKQKVDLEQECQTLEARKKFLADKIVELDKAAEDAKAKNAEMLHGMAIKTEAAREALETTQGEVNALDKKRLMLKGMVETMQKSTDEEGVRLNAILESKKDHIRELDGIIDGASEILLDLNNQVKAIKKAKADLDEELHVKTRDTEVKISQLNREIEAADAKYHKAVIKLDNKNDELKQITQDVADATKTLRESKTQHNNFVSYEQRSRAALEAREQSLLAREKEFEEKFSRANRRGGILNDV